MDTTHGPVRNFSDNNSLDEINNSKHNLTDYSECVSDSGGYPNYGVSVNYDMDSNKDLEKGTWLEHRLTRAKTDVPFVDGDYHGETDNQSAIHNKNIVKCIDDKDQSSETHTSKGGTSSEGQENTGDKNNPNSDVDHDDLDRGWAFLVLAGAFLTMVVTAIVGPCLGILFSSFLTNLNTPSIVTTSILNVSNFFWSLGILVTTPLMEEFGWRTLSLSGTLLCFLGVMASAFATSAEFLFFSSVMLGLGNGCMLMSSLSIVPFYFKRLRGRAMGIMLSGSSTGSIIGPPIVTYLQEDFGYRGATLIVAAYILHGWISAAVFRPVSRPKELNKHNRGELESAATKKRPKLYLILLSLGKNILLCRNLKVLIMCLGCAFITNCYFNVSSLIPFIMEANGHTQETAAWCLSLANLMNLASRLVTGSCSDMSWFSLRGSIISFNVLAAITTVVFPLMVDATAAAVVISVWGFAIGVVTTILPLLIVQYMGMDKFSSVLGLTGMFNGVWMLSSGPLLGLIRDLTRSYIISLSFLSGTVLINAILYLFLPLAVTYEEGREQRRSVKDVKVKEVEVG